MTPTLPFEPSCFIFGGTETDDDQFLSCFWPTFQAIEAFVELNSVSVPLSEDLQAAAATMFPWALHSIRASRQPYASLIVRFLEKRIVKPSYQYANMEDFVDVGSLQRAGTAYASDDVWISWRDLLAQLVQEAVGRKSTNSELMLSRCGWSCLTDPPLASWPTPGGGVFRLIGHRASSGNWPPGLVAPEPYLAMRRRKSPAAPSVRWEDGGHLPPKPIQRALTRTAGDLSWLVSRVATTYRADSTPDRCKVLPESECKDVGFRISDGHVLFKGVFTTIADTRDEQKVAVQLLGRHFKTRCESEGFVLGQ